MQSDSSPSSADIAADKEAKIENLNLGEMTPLEGLNYLNELQQRLKNRLD